MATTIEQLLIEIKADGKDLKKGLTGADNDIKKFEKDSKKSFINIQDIASTALGFSIANFAATAVGAVKDFVVGSLKSFVEFEQGMMSLQLQTEGTASSLISDLRKASKNMISDLNLISAANRALALGISKDQLPQLLEVATARAKVMGITTTQAFNDIATGIGRQSKLILDNLGIIIDLDKAYTNYAKTINTTSAALSESQKKVAISNEIYEQSKGLMFAMSIQGDTLSERLQQLTTKFDNIKLAVGEFVLASQTGAEEFRQFAEALNLPEDRIQKIEYTANQFTMMDKQIASAKDNLQGFVNDLNNLMGQKISGETQIDFDVKSAEKERNLARLGVSDLETRKREEINALIAEGIDRKLAENFINKEYAAEEERLNGILQDKNTILENLQLQRTVNFEDMKEMVIAKNKLEQANQTTYEVTIEKFGEMADAAVDGYARQKEALEGPDGLIETQKKLKKEVEDTVNLLLRLSSEQRVTLPSNLQTELSNRLSAPMNNQTYGNGNYFQFDKDSGLFNDFISRPGQPTARFSPSDTIIGVKDTSNLGGTTINISIDNVNGINADAIAMALNDKLRTLVRT